MLAAWRMFKHYICIRFRGSCIYVELYVRCVCTRLTWRYISIRSIWGYICTCSTLDCIMYAFYEAVYLHALRGVEQYMYTLYMRLYMHTLYLELYIYTLYVESVCIRFMCGYLYLPLDCIYVGLYIHTLYLGCLNAHFTWGGST